ncbi:MAG: hypothetical protein RIQ53_3025 [Pseudomonadota bacterium]
MTHHMTHHPAPEAPRAQPSALPARLAALAAAALLAACGNLAPVHERPAVTLPALSAAATEGAASAAANAPAAPLPAWQDLVREPRARQVIELALQHNTDLRLALLNVERSRAALRLTDADRWPTVNAAVSAQRAPNSQGVQTNTLQAGLQITAWELDLMGRLANLSTSAQATLMATEAAQRAARLALVTQTLSAWLTLAADGELQALAEQTLRDRQETERLALLRHRVGALADGDLRGVQALTEAARAGVAQARRQRALDEHALHALVGAPVPAALLPAPAIGALAAVDALAPLSPALDSDVLLRRPDVIQAEQTLRAAQADIGAARAAMWPRITLSASAGQVGSQLSQLFEGGHFAWSLASSAAVAIFDHGRNKANVQVSQIARDSAVAQYQKTVQTAFRETADALAGFSGWQTQLDAQRAQLQAEADRHRLSRLKYDAGAISQVDWLDAERSLTSARQAVVQVRLADALNRVALYKALGGDETRTAEAPATAAAQAGMATVAAVGTVDSPTAVAAAPRR